MNTKNYLRMLRFITRKTINHDSVSRNDHVHWVWTIRYLGNYRIHDNLHSDKLKAPDKTRAPCCARTHQPK